MSATVNMLNMTKSSVSTKLAKRTVTACLYAPQKYPYLLTDYTHTHTHTRLSQYKPVLAQAAAFQ